MGAFNSTISWVDSIAPLAGRSFHEASIRRSPSDMVELQSLQAVISWRGSLVDPPLEEEKLPRSAQLR